MHLLVAVALFMGGTGAPKLAMPGLETLGLDQQRAAFLGEHLAQELKFAGVSVITSREISTLLGMERQKSLLGCAEGKSCMAELASALGADALVLGDVAKIGSKFQVNLKVISATDARTLAAYSERVESEEAVLDALSRAADQFARTVSGALGKPLTPVARNGTSSSGSAWWLPVVAGAVVAGIGAGLYVSGTTDYAQLTGATSARPLAVAEAQALRDGGKVKEGIAVGCFAAGGAAIAAGVIWFATTRTASTPTVTVVPTFNGGTVVISGAFP